ncbi:MAG: DivIVA domain-containing protein [Clostridia bacterium]|nr:DivIVA domain-containing protein [Clostridia bacterium]
MTQEEILKPSFGSAGRGVYKISDVENHLSKVSEYCHSLLISLEKAESEKRELNEKISILSEKLDEYKKEEDNIKITLLNAQRMAANIRKESEAQRDEIIEDAKKQHDSIVESAKMKALDEISEIKEKNEAYITDTVTKADEYFARAKYEYETKSAEAEAKAADTLHDAAKKAEYILSEARIRAAAAVEKANAAIAHMKDDNSDAIIAMQREMSTIRNIVMNYKDEIASVIMKNLELLENLEEPEAVTAMLDKSLFEPLSSEINDEPPEVNDENNSLDSVARKYLNDPEPPIIKAAQSDGSNTSENRKKTGEEHNNNRLFTLDGESDGDEMKEKSDLIGLILDSVETEMSENDEDASAAIYERPSNFSIEEKKKERTKVFDPIKIDEPEFRSFVAGFKVYDDDNEVEEDGSIHERRFFQKYKKKK